MSDLRPAVQKLMVFNNHHINHMTNIGWCPFIILKYMVISKPPYPPKHNHQPSCVFMSHYSLQTYIRIIMVEHQRVDLCHTHPNLLRIKAITQSVNVILRAVKTGGPARFGPAQSGFGLHRAGLGKVWPEPGPVRAFGPAHIFFLFFFFIQCVCLNPSWKHITGQPHLDHGAFHLSINHSGHSNYIII